MQGGWAGAEHLPPPARRWGGGGLRVSCPGPQGLPERVGCREVMGVDPPPTPGDASRSGVGAPTRGGDSTQEGTGPAPGAR